MRPFRLVGIVLVFSLAAGPLAAAQKPAAAPAPDTAGYYFLLARHLESSKKIDEAIDALKKAIELSPRSAELRAELAGVYARQDRAREALEAAEAALQQRSCQPRGEPDPRIGLRRPERAAAGRFVPATILLSTRARAVAALEKSRPRRRRRPQSRADARSALSRRRQLRQGDLQPAASRRRAARLSRGRHAPVGGAGGAGQTDDAIGTLELTLEENPEFFRGYVRLAELYERQRRFQDAADAYGQAQAANSRADLTRASAPPLSSTPANRRRPATCCRRTSARKTAPDAACCTCWRSPSAC